MYEAAPSGFAGSDISRRTLELPRSVFTGTSLRTNQMSVFAIAERIPEADSAAEQRALSVAVNKRYANLFLPLVIALFTTPFAIGMQRKGRVVSISYGVGLWLVFTVALSLFEQLGLVGTLPAVIAVWAPMAAFTMFGIYLISRLRT
jgi:lipopolysaccharide export LptBFGC system permease protein LptF